MTGFVVYYRPVWEQHSEQDRIVLVKDCAHMSEAILAVQDRHQGAIIFVQCVREDTDGIRGVEAISVLDPPARAHEHTCYTAAIRDMAKRNMPPLTATYIEALERIARASDDLWENLSRDAVPQEHVDLLREKANALYDALKVVDFLRRDRPYTS